MARGAVARRNRSARRASRAATGVNEARHRTPRAALAATGSTSLPLSDRDTGWDAGAARKSLSEAQYPKAHFWRDPEGDPKTLAAYKLPFADASGGTLTAVWKGVTASAGAVQGARGGVQIPDADAAGVKAKIGAYYRKAAKKYNDPNIAPPWTASSSDRAALLLAYAECAGAGELDPLTDDEGLVGVGGSGPAMDEFLARRAFWAAEFQEPMVGECTCGHMADAHEDGTGACSVPGCGCEEFEQASGAATTDLSGGDADSRRGTETPERAALAALEVFQHGVRCGCGHDLDEHLGADGPCTHEDGRGKCSCGSYAEAGLAERHAGVTSAANERRRALRAVVAAAQPQPNIQVTLETTQAWDGAPAFAQAALGLTERSRMEWPSEATVEPAGDVLFRDDRGYVARLGDGLVVSVHSGGGWVHVEAAAAGYAAAQDAIATFMAEYPPMFRDASEDEGVVPITFWTYGQFGPSRRMRLIDASPWAEIETNYPEEVRGDLAAMMAGFEPGAGGQLLLWQGPPGTGKTWALRALASEWAPWAEFHYITDPDAFFVSNPDYMIDVLLADSYETIDRASGDLVTEAGEGKWRVLILEDTGELLAADAKEKQGQGVSRLLNVVDGMVGQGLRILVLLTTNDELGDLHPAAQRPGRCAARLTFGPFSPGEAAEWLGGEVDGPLTIAELYARREDGEAAFESEPAVTAAAGDVAWGPEDGFRDLLQDVNELLCPDDAPVLPSCGCRAIDAAVTLDRVLIRDSDADAFWVAPISVDASAQPTLSPASEWVPVEQGWVETVPQGPEQVAASSGWTIRDMMANSTMNLRLGTLTFDPASFAPGDVPLPAGHEPGETIPARRSTVAPAESAPAGGLLKWTAVFCPEATLTDDGRAFKPGSISWRDLPLSLMGMTETQEGHDGAEVCGRIEQVWRDGSLIRAAGVFDEGEYGQEIGRLVGDGTLRGLSVDLAIRDFEVGPRGDYFDGEGNWIDQPSAASEGDEPSLLDMLLGPEEDVIYVVTDAVIGMATVCPFPAFAEASITLTSSGLLRWTYRHQAGFTVTADARPPASSPGVASRGDAGDALLASGVGPAEPPAWWFNDPGLEEVTPLTVADDGRVFGHLAPWGVCHIGLPGCRTAPSSPSGYRYLHLASVACEGGDEVGVGKITLGTGHADIGLGARAAAEHYDNTGTVAAYVRAGEDEHGIWVAGAISPDLDEAGLRKLRGAVLSGDWRNINGGLEMVAALAVNVPGFPVPRSPRAMVASGEDGSPVMLSLVAAGVHYATPDADELAAIRAVADRAGVDEGTREEIARLVGRVA